MSKRIELSGKRFGRLLVVAYDSTRNNGCHWLCQCDCGKPSVVLGSALRDGRQSSCGCLKQELVADKNRTHGGCGVEGYGNWEAMIGRCYNGNNSAYAKYGGRGIRVCEFLRATPLNLIILLGEKPTPKHSIDRFPERRGHYSCGSCSECLRLGLSLNVRWATMMEQARNTSRNRMFTINGETKCATDWALSVGLSPQAFTDRMEHGRNPFAPSRNSKPEAIP